jgi:hypothetical protein
LTASDASSLIYTGVEEIVPEEPTVTALLKLELLVLTSKPDGGVTSIAASILAPDTLKLVEEDAVPDVVLRAEGVPVVEIVGVTTLKIVDAPDAGAKLPAKSEAVPAAIEMPKVPAPVMPEMVTV